MKIIDLLNKAARGEELPYRIRLIGCPNKEIWTLRDGGMYESFFEVSHDEGCEWFLLTDYLDSLFDSQQLNTEIEIVEDRE